MPTEQNQRAPFTPGPWRLCDGQTSISVRAGNGRAVAQVSLTDWRPHPQAEIDARLIKTAPRLYTALETLLREVNGEGIITVEAQEEAAAALAEARGQ